ncbi:ribosomal protein S23 [Hypoxylon texense]
MPTALHPQAKFDPIPPDLDLHALVDQTPNFDWVVRISTTQIRRLGAAGFEKLVQLHVIEGGRPLVIEGWNKALPGTLFGATWLEETYDKKQENVRDITAQTDIPMTTGHYLRSMRQLTNQWSPTNFRDERRQRLYLKDIDCPPEWYNHLKKVIPPNVFYMNENISENLNADTRDDDIFGAPEKTPAVAGDLMSSLPEEMRAQNLMCYIGHEGTYTPAHREMCASLGQNIMVEASADKNGEKPGSSIWFMTETKDREVVREYFLSMLGHDIEIEKHFAQINAWKKANFPVYIVEQKVGDFILIPPLAPHQVWNRGTRTVKVAWNRTTVETLDLALHEALPKARLVCRDEQYKNKAIIYFTLEKYYRDLQSPEENPEVGLLGFGQELIQNSVRMRQMAGDFRRLFGLFTEVLVDEMFAYKQADVEYVPFDSNITCSYCRSNIFNRFLTCKCCVRTLINGDEDTYDICMECYAMGRSCVCISGLQWCEQWKWSDLVEKHETWRSMVIQQDGFVDIKLSPQPIEIAGKMTDKKSVAQICQEQLRRRPWNDITKPPKAQAEESDEPEVDDEGRVKKKSKSRRKAKKGDVYACHVCCHKEYTYKLNFCTTCPNAYCYGVLWRAFDIMPQTAMETEHWRCPRCLNICNCGSCRQKGLTHPYVPKNTLLGHDTRPIADDRSVESIVDFRQHNLSWLKATGEENRSKDTKRMQRWKQQADAEKAKDPLASLNTADDAPHEMDLALQDSIMNGYGDQSHLLGHAGTIADDNGYENGHENGQPSTTNVPDVNGPDGRAENADVSIIQNGEVDPDQSQYPDPSTMGGGRMMGMGFYDQDESTDRILFDPFQIPSADMVNDEPEVSDFVKKTLRLAKRKARLETNDDPDFRGPRNHRKKPKTGNIDQLVNLDPALLGALGNSTSTPTRSVTTDGPTEQADNGAASEPPREISEPALRPKPTRQPLPVDPLRPTLRHAKPMTSYVETEEPEIFDPDETVPVKALRLFLENEDGTPEDEQNPVDLAADAIRVLTQLPAGEKETPTTAKGTPQPGAKRRGRPPRNSLGSTPAAPIAPVTAPSTGKKRGRPRKSVIGEAETNKASTTAEATVEANNSDGTAQNESSVTVDELEAQLARELGDQNEDSEHLSRPATATSTPNVGSGKRRGRPPKRPRAQQAETAGPAEQAEQVEQAQQTPTVPQLDDSDSPAPDISFMSMRERAALRGRAFKIGSRRNRNGASGSPATAPSSAKRTPMAAATANRSVPDLDDMEESQPSPKRGRKELLDNDFEPAVIEVEDSPSSSPTPEAEEEVPETRRPVRKSGGPTVVRITFSDDSDSDSDSESDDDDDGVPNKPRKRNVATRGRGRGRGRGAGRGMGRGGRARGYV